MAWCMTRLSRFKMLHCLWIDTFIQNDKPVNYPLNGAKQTFDSHYNCEYLVADLVFALWFLDQD